MYHEATKHSYWSVRTGFHRLDWSNFPFQFKIYIKANQIKLPSVFPLPEEDTFIALCKNGVKENLDLKKISSVLFFSAGITRIKKFGEDHYFFRASPATGALYSTELYLIVQDFDSLEPGLYHFNPASFSLQQIGKGGFMKKLTEIALAKPKIAIVFSSYGFRNSWKYESRSYRHWFWDSGAIAANMFAVLGSFDIKSSLILNFLDDELNSLLGLDPKKEVSLFIVKIGEADAKDMELSELDRDYIKMARYEIEYPLINMIHNASKLRSTSEIHVLRSKSLELRKTKEEITLPKPREFSGKKLYETILKRGSSRRFSREEIKLQDLSDILHYSKPILERDFKVPIEIFLIINAVQGIENGSYYYTGEGLVQLKKGNFRKEAGYLCLEQQLAEDASVVLFLMTDLKKVLKEYGNRGYRACQLEAGIMLGRIYLASYALGLGASGITFYDDEISKFFSPHAKDLSNLVCAVIGKTAYKSKPGRIILDAIKYLKVNY